MLFYEVSYDALAGRRVDASTWSGVIGRMGGRMTVAGEMAALEVWIEWWRNIGPIAIYGICCVYGV